MDRTEYALNLVRKERLRQMRLFGEQIGLSPCERVSILGEEYGELCEAVNETVLSGVRHPERGGCENIIKEATHVAAVAVSIIEYVQRASEVEWGPSCKPIHSHHTTTQN